MATDSYLTAEELTNYEALLEEFVTAVGNYVDFHHWKRHWAHNDPRISGVDECERLESLVALFAKVAKTTEYKITYTIVKEC